MKTKIAPFISPAAIAIALFFAVALTHGATVTVINTNDSGAGSLRQALAMANDGDTITFAVSGTIGLSSGELLVDKSITISGPGAGSLAVDGNATSRVFHIGSGKTVTISGLTITNGHVNGSNGGGIYNDQATLTLSNCAIRGNVSSVEYECCDGWSCDECTFAIGGLGGGIYNYHATLTLSNCTISGNNGGGIYNDAVAGSATLLISNSVVSENNGSGIYNDAVAGSSSVLISNSVVSKNNSSWLLGGTGGIHNSGDFGSSARVEITDSAISGNTGGIQNSVNLTLSNCTISGNSSPLYGGGITNDGARLTLTNCTISGNSSSQGGGIYTFNHSYLATAEVDITDSTISGNEAVNGGGGIFNGGPVGSAGSNMTLSNCTISGNSAPSAGGIANDGARLTLTNCTISGNSSYIGGGIVSGNTNGNEVVGIYNSTFSGNSGGGIYYEGGTTPLQIGNTILKAGASGDNIFNHSAGTIISQGYNLSSDNGGGYLTGPGDQINTDPRLGPLQDNGGPTFTHELLTGSPAINVGNPNFTPPPFYDQRSTGFDRVRNGRVDIGAFEVQGPTAIPPDVITLTASIGPRSNGKNTVNLSWTGANVPIINILRNGTLLVTTQNTGSYTDYIPAKQRGTYTYKVCETGTSTCSNEATVTFR